jgi:WD40 repeat protein
MRATIITALVLAVDLAGSTSAQARRLPSASAADSVGTYSGVYASTINESIFSACDVRGIGSGWWLRFNNERDGRFLRYQYGAGGMPTVSHFIRVRGRISPPGHYGQGFQTREIVVDSVLDVQETMQPCASYEDLPQPWEKIKPSGAAIIGAAFSDDGATVAVLDRDGLISVWNSRLGTMVTQFPSDDKGDLNGFRIPLVFTHDGRRLAAGGVDGVVRVWNPLNGQRIWTFAATDTAPGTVNGRRVVAASQGLDFNRSGTLLASVVSGGVAIWSTVDGKRVATFKDGRWNLKFLFIDDSSFMASGDSGLVRIYPKLGAAPIWSEKIGVQWFEHMYRSPDGQWLVANGWNDTAYLWSLAEGRLAHKIAIPRWFGFGAIGFSPDGKIMATSGGANGLYLWDTKTGQPLESFQKYPNILLRIWFTGDGRSIVTYSLNDTALRIVHLDSRRAEPVQAWWGANSWPTPIPGRALGSVVGFVRDPEKKPIVGADIAAFDGDKPGSAPLATTTTNVAGRFLLQGLKVRHVSVRAMMRGFAPDARNTHLAAQEVDVSFEMKRDPSGD